MELLSQVEQPRSDPEHDSIRDVSMMGEPRRSPTEPSLQYPSQEWAILKVKNINLLPAYYGFDTAEWPGDDLGIHQVIKAMAEALRWDHTQLKWFLKSRNTLWAFRKEKKPTGSGRSFAEHITRKTNIIGILPLRLFPVCENDRAHGPSNTDPYRNPIWTRGHAPRGFDWRQKKYDWKSYSKDLHMILFSLLTPTSDS